MQVCNIYIYALTECMCGAAGNHEPVCVRLGRLFNCLYIHMCRFFGEMIL